MRRTVFLCMLLALSPPGRAQVTSTPPWSGGSQGQGIGTSEAQYGPPRVIEFDAIYSMPESYQRAHVLTEGEIDRVPGTQFWALRQGGASLLLIPGSAVDTSAFGALAGKRTEVRGIVRMLRPKQFVGRPPTDLDLVEDPILPPMPAPAIELPKASITVLAFRDRTSPEGFKKDEIGSGITRQILDEPSAYVGKTTKILGQFRGRNLFSDLPPSSARGKDDWVLKDGDTAVWVMGKAPKGDGWKLDLEYKGDSKTWLEVEGKPEVVNGVVYLKASRVIPSRAPGTERRTPPPR